MGPTFTEEFNRLKNLTASCPNIPKQFAFRIFDTLYDNAKQNKVSEPMLWIGIYIALASLICTIAMMVDLLHGLRKSKLWFPCKYFTLNAASLTVIAVAIKLPMDLTTLMSSHVDQLTKLGSLTFMCTIMANLLPSLANMDNEELVSNMIALWLLVVTLVVNVCIQVHTSLINNYIHAIILVGVLLMYLIIYTCSSIAILKSKQILESNYQATHQRVLKDQEMQQQGRMNVETLKQHVSNYWIMAGTGCPQFMIACSVTTSACGVICAFSNIIFIYQMIDFTYFLRHYNSDYKWSIAVILIIQSIGVVVGTIAPLFRCFATLSFKLSIKWIGNRIKVFKVESYWTQMLCDLKHSSIPMQSSSPKFKFFIQSSKILVLNICIGFQKTIVVICKMISVIPIIFVIFFLCCICCWKWLKAMFSTLGIVLRKKHKEQQQQQKDKDINLYALQLPDGMEFAERTLKGICKSMKKLIKKAKKQQPKNLMKLLAISRGFGGVEKFDNHHVPPLLSEEFLTCWSLTLVTLTTIAMSLPNIHKNIIDRLLSGVSEGLVYVTLVEESLNATADHVCIQKAAKTLWLEVEIYRKWLGNKLPKSAPQGNTAGRILLWLRNTAKNMVTDVTGVPNDNYSKCKSISANSMYRITETLLLSYHENIDQLSQEELFEQLSSMIADILAACLTNLPQLIAMKCHTSGIEKREESVYVAVQLLGETMEIINTLKEREIPTLNLSELAYIENWSNYLSNP